MKDISYNQNKRKQTEKLFSTTRNLKYFDINSKRVSFFSHKLFRLANFLASKIKLNSQKVAISFFSIMLVVNVVSAASMATLAIKESSYTSKVERILSLESGDKLSWTKETVSEGIIIEEDDGNKVVVKHITMYENIDNISGLSNR